MWIICFPLFCFLWPQLTCIIEIYLKRERGREILLLYLTVILNIVHIKRDFNCDDALFELFCTSDVFHKSLLIVHCYKIVCIYFKLWSEILFYTFLYLLKNYWFTYLETLVCWNIFCVNKIYPTSLLFNFINSVGFFRHI